MEHNETKTKRKRGAPLGNQNARKPFNKRNTKEFFQNETNDLNYFLDFMLDNINTVKQRG